jgi:hypothetical protein
MNNNNNRKRGKRSRRQKRGRIRQRRYNNGRFNIVNYNARTRPSTFGPGSYFISITKLVSGSLSTEVVIRIWEDVLLNNVEFERVQDDFKYFKLRGIAVTFHPRNLPIAANQKPAYMILNYDGKTTTNMRLQDSAKIIPAYLPNFKIFKFNIPKINSVAGVMNSWTNKSDLDTWRDLKLQIHAPDNTTDWNFKVDVLLNMRGPTVAENKSRTQVITTDELLKRMGSLVLGSEVKNEDEIATSDSIA